MAVSVAIEVVVGSVVTIAANGVVVGMALGKRDQVLTQVQQDVTTIKQALGLANGSAKTKFMPRESCELVHEALMERLHALEKVSDPEGTPH